MPNQLTATIKPLHSPPHREYLALRHESGRHTSQKGCQTLWFSNGIVLFVHPVCNEIDSNEKCVFFVVQALV